MHSGSRLTGRLNVSSYFPCHFLLVYYLLVHQSNGIFMALKQHWEDWKGRFLAVIVVYVFPCCLFLCIVMFSWVLWDKDRGWSEFSDIFCGSLVIHSIESIVKEMINKVVGHLLEWLEDSCCLLLTVLSWPRARGHWIDNQLEQCTVITSFPHHILRFVPHTCSAR